MLAGLWAIGGVVFGLFGLQSLRPFSTQLLEWYHSRNADAERLELMCALVDKGKTNTEEFERCMAEQAFGMYLLLPPIFGLLHGVLLGAIGGVLCGLVSGSSISASAAAVLGMVVGPVLVAFAASVTLARIVPLDERLPVRSRLARRGLLMISPLLIIPAGWHCLKRTFWKGKAA